MRIVFASISLAAMALAVAIASQPHIAEPDGFYKAIRSNDLGEIQKLVSSNGPNVADADGNTPLMLAALDGTPDAMRLLLNAGANPNLANAAKATPLMWCVGDPVKVRMLLDKGADVNAVSADALTPLALACGYDNSGEIVKLLLAKGAQVDAQNGAGFTPLEIACGMNNLRSAKLLISHGADVNHLDKSHQSPLLWAANSGHDCGELVRYLLGRGASPKTAAAESAVPPVQNGALAIGSFTSLHEAAQLSADATKALIEAGVDVNAKDVRGATPLAFAVATDHPILPAISKGSVFRLCRS